MRQLLIKEIKDFIRVKKVDHVDSNDLEATPMTTLENLYEGLVHQYGPITEKDKLNLSFDRQ